MEIRQVQYFLSIVITGSFSAAADEHYISQSSLSKKILALEKELGVPLFDRSRRKVALTDAGEVFLEHARGLDAAYRAMIVDLGRHKTDTDYLAIAAIPVLTQYGITNQIGRFRELHPKIQLTLQEIDGTNISPALAEYQYDLAFTRHNFINLDKFESVKICQDRLLAVVSPKNDHATRSSVSLQELSQENFIVFDRVTDLHQLLMDECRKAGFDPTIFYSSQHKASVLGLVGANIGITLMPARIFAYHKQADVIAIPLEENIACNIVLIYLKNRKLPRAASLFVDFMRQEAAQND